MQKYASNLGGPRDPGGREYGSAGPFLISWLPKLARYSTNPKDLGPEDPYPKGNLRKEGKREDGRLDLSLRLVGPRGSGGYLYTYIKHK